MAKIANVALTNTFDTWRSRSNEAFDRLSQFAINNSSLYANTLTANASFRAKGTSVLQGGVTMNRSLVVNNNITSSGNTTITGLATASGRLTVGTNLTVSGNTTLGAASKTITTTGAWSHTGTQTVSTNLTVSGNTTLGGANKTLTIGGAGATTNATGWFGVNGRQSISTNLFVGGNTAIGGSITAGSYTGLVNITGRAAIGTNLTVSGNTTLGAAGKVANATGWFGVTGRQSISTNLFVGGNTTLNGTTTDNSNALAQTLTDGATINWDVALGRVATVTLGAAGRAFAAPTNLKVGTYILRVFQDGTGSRTITSWNAVFKWTAAVAPVLSTGAGKLDIITLFSDGTNLYGSYLPDMR